MKLSAFAGIAGVAFAGVAMAAPTGNGRINYGDGVGNLGGSVRDGVVIYDQAPDPAVVGGFFSDGVAGQFNSQQIADNFTGISSTNGAWFYGGSEGFIFPGLDNFSGFTIQILDDTFTQVYSEVIAIGDTNASLTGRQYTDAMGAPVSDEYVFHVKFASDVQLDAGAQYWFSVGANAIAPGDDGWIWTSSVDGDGTLAGDFFDGMGYAAFAGAGDVAFGLQGVPAPGAAALFGIGGLAASRRRRG